MTIETTFFNRCIATLERALGRLEQSDPDDIDYELYRCACVKEFEIILEQAGKLLRKCLNDYMHSAKAVQQLVFKDIFRQACQHGFLTEEETERWLIYRDNRNHTAHDYGMKFAEETKALLPDFIKDSKSLFITTECQPSLETALA